MAARPLTVVKVGGSLVADAPRLETLLAGLAEGAEGRAVIVPGGGPFADAVRVTQVSLGFGDRLAHRLALDAMGHMAEVFCALEPQLTVAAGALAVPDALLQRRAVVWSPADLRNGHRDIPESWDVTSDSLALWLAATLGAARCILIKAAPCPAHADLDALAGSGLVDPAFPAFAAAFAGEIVLRGPGDGPSRTGHPDQAQVPFPESGEGGRRAD